jgi:hypothetical protein
LPPITAAALDRMGETASLARVFALASPGELSFGANIG